MNVLGYLYRRPKKTPAEQTGPDHISDGLPDQILKGELKHAFILYIVIVL
jgi:hypothetical protein